MSRMLNKKTARRKCTKKAGRKTKVSFLSLTRINGQRKLVSMND